MALKFKAGDLFENVEHGDIITHGCNAQGVMGSGFAAQLRAKYPWAYDAYRINHKYKGLRLGDVVIANNGPLYPVILNAITQEYYGRDPNILYVDYAAVDKSMRTVADAAFSNEKKVHLPFIGGGLANGDRSLLMGIFKNAFANVDATLWIK